MLRIYTLSNCDTCRAATRWLRAHGFEFEERPIRETPPTRPELHAMIAAQDGELRKVFNTSGAEFRAQKLGEHLATMTAAEAIERLATNGSLVKRPFLIGDGVALTGFDEQRWEALLHR